MPVVVSALSSQRGPRAWLTAGAVALLLGLFYALALGGAWHKSLTFDETAHISAGYSYWTLNDYRLQPENGNLPQRWAALPLLRPAWGATDPLLPASQVLPIQGRYRLNYFGSDSWPSSDVWGIGNRLFFQEGNPADSILRQSRGAIAVLSVLTGLVVFFWGRQLFGTRGGLISLALFALSPTMLAHGALATSDMAAALFLTLSLWCLWQLLHEVTWLRVSASCLAMGGLFLAKFSAPVIVLIAAPLVVVRLLNRAPLVVHLARRHELRGPWRQLAIVVGLVAAHAVAVWALIWVAYGFRYSAFAGPATDAQFSPHGWPWVFTMLPPDTSWSGWALQQATASHVLPEAFLFGFAHLLIFSTHRSAFLLGHFGAGWAWFFPYAFLVKTTLWELAVLALALSAAIKTWRSARPGPSQAGSAPAPAAGRAPQLAGARAQRSGVLAALYRTAPLWLMLTVYWAVSIGSGLNIGHRHLLPTYPIIFILGGAAAYWFGHEGSHAPSRGWRVGQALTVLVLAGLLVETLVVFPNYLAYFNLLIGSRTNAYKHLVDSSLDWGQDLPGLENWLQDQKLAYQVHTPVYLSYFGTSDPHHYGIRAQHLPSYFERLPDEPSTPLRPGVYCISATMLQGVYLSTPGPWRKQYEEMYQAKRWQVTQVLISEGGRGAAEVFQDVGRGVWDWKAAAERDERYLPQYRAQLAAQLQRFEQADPGTRSQVLDNEGRRFFGEYEQMRFARLCSYLRHREPDAEVNYSILVFKLTQQDLDKALDGAWSEPPTVLSWLWP
jgi:hypothetical protein